jgi:hypothetical protein
MASGQESPAQRVLRLPELVAIIIDFASDDYDAGAGVLAAAMLVNRVWAATALPLRWHRVPQAALHAVPTRRCAVYDAAVRAVDLQLWRAQRVKAAWTLPQLHTLSLAYGGVLPMSVDDASAAAAYVSRWAETLTSVTIGPAASARAVKAAKAAAAKRQRTRRSRANTRRSGPSSTGPQPWPLALPNNSFFRRDISTDVIVQLARCAALRTVTLAAPTVRRQALRAVQQAHIAAPFPALVAWSSVVRVDAVDGLCRLLASVLRLELTVDGVFLREEAWASFSRLRRLQSFTLRQSSASWATGLQRLRHMSHLCELDVQTTNMFDVFTDDDLRTLLRGLAGLRHLRLSFPSAFSCSASLFPANIARS